MFEINPQQLALEEMRILLQKEFDAGDALDQKASVVVGAASLVLTLVAALQISTIPHEPRPSVLTLIGLVIGAYVVLVILSLFAINPGTYQTAIRPDRPTIENWVLNLTGQEAILNILSGYIDQVTHNQAVNSRKVMLVRVSLLLLAAIVSLLIYIGFIPPAP